ncbi:MAG TPA: GNAT family N-acetyltransferase [Anaerolineae bacterium]|nr:GNAT family N-acetyltransferase [Anaerolineae bacterium]HQI84817.1 GNAT family N-acetyltransferase [Anaerolineae bacterium]
MVVQIRTIGVEEFPLYDAIPNHFEVRSVFQVVALDGGLGGLQLIEQPVAPYTKPYDNDGPTAWAKEFDLQTWGIFVAFDGEKPVGGAAVALNAQVYPLDHFQRKDLAVLWDIRVHPDARGRGIGAQLFRHAAEWARGQGYGQLGLETQNVNVPACRFYARQGCTLGAIHRFGYAGVPNVAHEAMLLWYLDL